ncbi:MAG: DUF983 domain-containing protein [Bosea sp. (in: a-proteobacteria)]
MPFTTSVASETASERDWRVAVGRGIRCRCPACGEGKLYNGFLKPVAACEACGEDLSHQRADDMPPYIVITIVGHIVVGGMLLAERFGEWSMATHMMVWISLTIILAIGLLQPVKGGVIGLQWALRMHGFAKDHVGDDHQNGLTDQKRSTAS